MDFSTLLPGPYATLLLADLGAEVLKISSRDRYDLVVHWPPVLEGTDTTAAAAATRITVQEGSSFASQSGTVSMEDVLEELVGDIWDESDVVEEEIVEKNEGEYELDGDMMLSDFEELFSLDDEGFEAESETVGGWTVEMFGRYPAPGESFTYDRLTVTVLEADHRRVEKVRVVAAPEPEKE